MLRATFTKIIKSESGQLLLEIIIAISVAAVVITLCANFIFLSLRSNKASAEKNIALGLIDETLESIQAASTERWQNLYNLTHSTTDYHPIQSSGKWDITPVGTDNVTLNGIVYTRGFRIFYVCRDTVTRIITGISDSAGGVETGCVGSGGAADPSTQKVTATITWNGNTVTASEYFAGRFRNRGCNQTGWTTGADNNPYSCAAGGTPTSNYFAQCDIDTTVSTQLKLVENCP